MKVAILAGGHGSRIAEETHARPKPMVEIGGRPLLWHIMKIYGRYGHRDFVVAAGYKGERIEEYFRDDPHPEWSVDVVDTGLKTQTGGRIRRLAPHLGGGTFMLTWGDGLADIDIGGLLAFHRSHGKLATLTAVRPPARYGHLRFDGDRVREFTEKPQTAEGWINGAFFVLEPAVFDYIEGDSTHWEAAPLENLARDGQLMAYRHDSFWQCMDTLREKVILERLWSGGSAPWKVWAD